MFNVFISLIVGFALYSGSASAQLRFEDGVRWTQVPVHTPAGNAGLIMLGDVNGDGKADLALYNQQLGEAYVALSTGRGFASPLRFAVGLPKWSGRFFQADLADVNGDGKADLVVLSRGRDDVPGDATALVALSTGTGFSYPANPTWNASWCADYQICLFGDLNGDHRADMTAFTPNFGTLWGSLSTGTAFGPNATWHNFFCISGEVCALGDVDGDGRADAIAFKPNAPGVQKGNVLVARSTGSAFVDVSLGHGFFCIENERCLVGDVNGDRRADIVLLKGFGIPGWTRLQVLASLSNGRQFINANPFEWAQIPYFNPQERSFGTFYLADVTGDGKADLVEVGITSRPTGGGGFQTTGIAVDVFVTTDRPRPTPSASTVPSRPTQQGGFSKVNVYNCQTEQNRLHYWIADNTTGAVDQRGPIDAMYSEWGTCPDANDSPEIFTLTDGHLHTIVAVNPSAIGCEGRNDPSIVACVVNGATFRGSAAGGQCNWILSAGAVNCGSGTGILSQGLGTTTTPAPPTCVSGFVWREARAGDTICVTPQTRDMTRDENQRALERRLGTIGPYGPATCKSGFVWREAFDGDLVCVPPERRDQAWADNAAQGQRVVR